jgi:hypothetical protein
MRQVMIKTVCRGQRASESLAHPPAVPGNYNNCALQIRAINNVPDQVSNAQVLMAFRATADVSWLKSLNPNGNPRLEYDYSEIGAGKIIRR